MPTHINIIGGMPSVKIKRNEKLHFKSSDDTDYEVNFNDSDITKEKLPFQVPGDGSEHKLKVKGEAKKQDYQCYIYEKVNTQQSSEKPKPIKKDQTPPRMIIKVE